MCTFWFGYVHSFPDRSFTWRESVCELGQFSSLSEIVDGDKLTMAAWQSLHRCLATLDI